MVGQQAGFGASVRKTFQEIDKTRNRVVRYQHVRPPRLKHVLCQGIRLDGAAVEQDATATGRNVE